MVKFSLLYIEDKIDMIGDLETPLKKRYDKDIEFSFESDFDVAKNTVNDKIFDIVVIDVKDGLGNYSGLDIYEKVLEYGLVHTIFFTGFLSDIKKTKIEESDYCSIIEKNTSGRDNILKKIDEIINSELFLFKKEIIILTNKSIRESIDVLFNLWQNSNFTKDEKKKLIINRLSHTVLNNNNFDRKSNSDYFIFPPLKNSNANFQMGDIVYPKSENEMPQNQRNYYIILNRDCSLTLVNPRKGKEPLPKTEKILFASIFELRELWENYYTRLEIKTKKRKSKKSFLMEILAQKISRFFLIPFDFISNKVLIDFENLTSLDYVHFSNEYEVITSLVDDFRHRINQRFSLHYSSIGYADFDENTLIQSLLDP
ncbi:hypothetical protein DSAG12_03023 [Promethearchaeum syntrophicum]|uniref:Uncharacterized protein n=1 Tax=Promethearchaeum syntrophicum TaxID=2594042 RepID=A0A5B9DDW8_9ARCH|nr:hypothetical protein [Candidatus Prometheoarchaeum syntrophicum]QEE17191.1 hypothetical protein DSAG12_03023 [Candidatus Prometheoarchaeum syntrophicum]